MYNQDVILTKHDLINKVQTLIDQNEDMLHSKKGGFSNFILKTLKTLTLLPLYPFWMACGAAAAAENWFGKIFGAILLNLVVMPPYIVITAIRLVLSAICLPFSLVSEIIPSVFSKKYRRECKLSINVKRLNSILQQLRLSTVIEINEEVIFEDEVNKYINKIESLNKQLNRNQTTIDYDVCDFETKSNKTTNNNQTTTHQEKDKVTYKEQDKEL